MLFKGSEKLPVTDDIYEEVLCLPMHYELSNEDIKEVCGRIKEFMAHSTNEIGIES